MRVAIFIIVLVLLVAALSYIAIYLRGSVARADARRRERAMWTVTPRTEGFRTQLFLTRYGSDDVLFWPTEETRGLGYESAMMEAELAAKEYNRINKELSA